MSKRLLCAAVLSLVACASGEVQRRPAHAAFTRTAFDDVWARAGHVLEGQGYTLELQDRARGILVTGARELQAPCGAETCLSRERVYLRVTTAGQAIANILREHWDPATRRWDATSDRTSVAAVEQAERELLALVVGGGPVVVRQSRLEEPCGGDGECERGFSCWSRRCYPSCKDDAGCARGQVCSPEAQVCQAAPVGPAAER